MFLQQQAIVSGCRGYDIFFDFDIRRLAYLVKAGGMYRELYDGLTRRMER